MERKILPIHFLTLGEYDSYFTLHTTVYTVYTAKTYEFPELDLKYSSF
jgi:hypothetical protein